MCWLVYRGYVFVSGETEMTHLITKRPDNHVIPSEDLAHCEERDPSMKEYVWVWSAHLGGYVGYVREDVYVEGMRISQAFDTHLNVLQQS